MDFVTDNIALIPVVTGIVEVAKRFGLPTHWAPLVSLALGIVSGFVYLYPGEPAQAVLAGVVIGLSASGLYSGVKNTAQQMSKPK